MSISNFGTAGVKPGVCTSTTRPTAPYEGQYIYETDTDKTLFWNGSLWREIVLTTIGGAWQNGMSTVNPADVSNGWFRYGALPEVTMETGTSVFVTYSLVCSANANGKTVQIAPSVSGATTFNGRNGNWTASAYFNGGVASSSYGRQITVNAGTNEFYLELIADGGSYALSFRAAMQVFRLN
jgi:hypothetical protein